MQIMLKKIFSVFALFIIMIGCTKQAETPTCSFVPITPTPTGPNFANFTLLGPEINGPVNSVFVQDDYAYLGVGDSMVILDVSNPAESRQLGFYPNSTAPFQVKNDHAYVYWKGELQILDISDPTNPVEVSCLEGNSQELEGLENAVFSGNYNYFPKGHELKIYDVTELANPIELSSYQPQSLSRLNWSQFLPRLNWYISPYILPDKFAPAPVPFYEPSEPISVLDVAVSGQYAYVGEGQRGGDAHGQLSILDVSNPKKPKRIGVYPMPPNTAAMKVSLDGNYAFVSTFRTYETQRTAVLDISNPKNPVEVYRFATGALIAVHEGLAYFPTIASDGIKNELNVWDVSDPTAPTLLNTIALPVHSTTLHSSELPDMIFDGDYVYMPMYDNGLYILDVSDPANIREVNVVRFYNTPSIRELAILDKEAYFLFRGNYLGIIDLLKSETELAWGVISEVNARDIDIVGQYAYIARGEEGLSIFDVSDPTFPTIVSTYTANNFQADRIVGQDNYIYVLQENEGVLILDVSDPSNLIPVNKYKMDLPFYSKDIAVWDNFIYIVTWDNGGHLYIIDISDPTKPTELAQYQNPDYFNSVAAAKKYVYIVTSRDHVTVFDVQDPTTPIKVGVYDLQYSLQDIDLENDKLYMSFRSFLGKNNLASVEVDALLEDAANNLLDD